MKAIGIIKNIAERKKKERTIIKKEGGYKYFKKHSTVKWK